MGPDGRRERLGGVVAVDETYGGESEGRGHKTRNKASVVVAAEADGRSIGHIWQR
jgi:hypothetical protein